MSVVKAQLVQRLRFQIPYAVESERAAELVHEYVKAHVELAYCAPWRFTDRKWANIDKGLLGCEVEIEIALPDIKHLRETLIEVREQRGLTTDDDGESEDTE